MALVQNCTSIKKQYYSFLYISYISKQTKENFI